MSDSPCQNYTRRAGPTYIVVIYRTDGTQAARYADSLEEATEHATQAYLDDEIAHCEIEPINQEDHHHA